MAVSNVVRHHVQVDENLTRLGQYVTNRRTERGYRTRKDLGDVLDFDYRVLSDIENGGRKAGPGSYAMLENALAWQPGSCAAILAGNEPTPTPEVAAEFTGHGGIEVVSLSQVPTDDLLEELRRRLDEPRGRASRNTSVPDRFPKFGAKAERRRR